MQKNLLAGILRVRIQEIETEVNLDLEVQTSPQAPDPPQSSPLQTSNAVNMSASNIQADQVLFARNIKFSHIVALIISSSARRQTLEGRNNKGKKLRWRAFLQDHYKSHVEQ